MRVSQLVEFWFVQFRTELDPKSPLTGAQPPACAEQICSNSLPEEYLIRSGD